MNVALEQKYITQAQQVIQIEYQAIKALIPRINQQFAKACDTINECIARLGHVVVVGVGKSGHIGKKIAATLASTGTPSFFVHASEANHGDMGMITQLDVILAISNSGETEELVRLLPLVKRKGWPLILLTGNLKSTLSQYADIILDVSVEKEACSLGLAPTASSTATLVMGDAMAIALLDAREFKPEDFALSHPGGRLGKRLILRVDDLMHTGESIPVVTLNATLKETLMEMTRCRLGMTAVIDENKQYLGLFTDGDLRRALNQPIDMDKTPISKLMTQGGQVIETGILAAEVLRMMETHKINGLFVINEQRLVIGALNMHDLLRAGIV